MTDTEMQCNFYACMRVKTPTRQDLSIQRAKCSLKLEKNFHWLTRTFAQACN